jgi:hypothetical protein
MSINTAGFLGDASVPINIDMCAGRAALSQGEATIRDACFTGDTTTWCCAQTQPPQVQSSALLWPEP